MQSISVTLKGLVPCLALSLASPSMAAVPGGGEEDVVLIVDPSSHEALTLANHYRAARNIPDQHVFLMAPGGTNYAETAAVQVRAFLGELVQRGLEDQIDFVVISPNGTYRIPAGGLVDDSCFPVNHFTVAAPYILARDTERILLGGLPSSRTNQYSRPNWAAAGFDSTTTWFGGQSSNNPNAKRYFIGGLLGYTGDLGNTRQEVVDLIHRSAAADGSFPAGTVYYMETTDQARSGPRHDFYPTAVTNLGNLGAQGQHLQGILPTGSFDCMGVMTGIADAPIDGGSFGMLPGSFGDHLTSYAGTFSGGQTKMSRWITAGASGTAGTVEEPCNYPGKFPHARLHVVYRKGLTLGESWFRSVGFEPFQNLFLGDPLTRPFEEAPTVNVSGFPGGPLAGTITLTPTATAYDPADAIASVELHVDGVRLMEETAGSPFALDTTQLDEGWHELRLVAVTDRNQRDRGRWVQAIEVDNLPEALTLQTMGTSGDLDTSFQVQWAASGGTPVRIEVRHMGRTVASDPALAGSLEIPARSVGAGPAHLQVFATFASGVTVRSAPLLLDIADTSSTPLPGAPTAHTSHRRVRNDQVCLVPLPVSSSEDPSALSTTLLTGPSQGTLLGSGPLWLVIEPNPGADGPDTITFQVSGPAGTSTIGEVTLHWYDPTPCGAEVFCTAEANSTGLPATIGWSGSASVSTNDLVLEAAQLPPGQFGLFFQGQGRTQTPLGAGWLCAAGGIARFAPQLIDGTGLASLALDLSQPPLPGATIAPGSSWIFQFWYRDPAGAPPGSNSTDALEVSFCP